MKWLALALVVIGVLLIVSVFRDRSLDLDRAVKRFLAGLYVAGAGLLLLFILVFLLV